MLRVNSRTLLDISHLYQRIERLREVGIVYTPRCGPHEISEDLLRSKLDSDYILSVKVGEDREENKGVAAYANSCIRDLNHNGRPVIGYTFMNTAVIDISEENF